MQCHNLAVIALPNDTSRAIPLTSGNRAESFDGPFNCHCRDPCLRPGTGNKRCERIERNGDGR